MSATGDVRRRITGATWLGLLLILVFTNGIAHGAAGDQDSPAALLTILASNEQSILVELQVDRYEIESVAQGGETYQRLHIAQMQLTSTPGAPQVPTLGALLGLPTTAGVRLEIVEAAYETLTGYRLYPAPHLALSGDGLTNFASGEV